MSDPILHFHGAAGSVTGSCFLLEFGKARILVDCGMFQGSKTEKELNYRPFPFEPSSIDCVLLTHAHIDHSGLLPKLAKNGFSGPIFATPATIDLCSIMLQDSGHIQESEVEQLNRRNRWRSREPVEAIYTADDARRLMPQFRGVDYGQWQAATEGVRFRFWNSGHLLGAASIELETAGEQDRRRILFSGDIGPQTKLLERPPEAPADVDYLVCESTYGDRERDEYTTQARRLRLQEIVAKAYQSNGVLLIPSFAVERTQEVLTDLIALMDQGTLARCPVVIDSPLASRATNVFKKHARSAINGEAFIRGLNAPNVGFTESAEQSKALDFVTGFHIIIAASGMCEAGRIRHRLRNWLWRPECTVLIVGFQAAGTLGRVLQEGASVVRIQGDEIKVRATIAVLDAYSGHADASELQEWVTQRRPIHKGLFLVHGEEPARHAMAARLKQLVPVAITFPCLDAGYRLTDTFAEPIVPPAYPRLQPEEAGHADWHNEYQNLLLDMSDRLSRAADRKHRDVILRRLRRALEAGTDSERNRRNENAVN
ncbi:MBL fold metallo-hydrolase RNA specificity domain-containing protein [Rhizobium sp. RAF56]|uniref:MBL fold metallo-hydrolase RNA specificity domain-containing protein n=1 Tax=Rhizobium sp. RAF56 TaxID=3233062 RepID=UPI003F98FDEE